MEKSSKEEGMEGMVVILQKVRRGVFASAPVDVPTRQSSPLAGPSDAARSNAHTQRHTVYEVSQNMSGVLELSSWCSSCSASQDAASRALSVGGD